MAEVNIDVAREQSVQAVNTSVGAVKTTVDTVGTKVDTANTTLNTINTNTAKIGATGDINGSGSSGTVMAKLNRLISDMANHVLSWSSARAAKLDLIDTINTNASNASSAATNASNTATSVSNAVAAMGTKIDTIKTNTSAGQNVVYNNIFSGVVGLGTANITGKGRVVIIWSAAAYASDSTVQIDNQVETALHAVYGSPIELYFNSTINIKNRSSNGTLYYIAQTV